MAGHESAGKVSSSHNRRGGRVSFPIGSAVEVNTDDEGYEKVYFTATIVLPLPSEMKTPETLFVEYTDLLASEDGSDPLREPVKVAFLRPPPPLEETAQGFKPNDVLDAFYQDGWWTGVVSRALEGGERFVVSFDDPPDELEFGLHELRAHWDWVNGKWVRPQSLMSGVGRRVEVSFDGEEFQDAWFPATIQQVLGNGKYLVEYSSSKGEAMRANVDSLHIRPCPPLLKGRNNFILLEKVGAFFDYGWWDGVINKELENSRCVVFFKQLKQDREFNRSELRPCMEWKDGKWFLDDGVHDNHNTPDENSAATASSVSGAKTLSSCTKRRQYRSDSGAALKKRKDGNVEGNVSPGSANSMKTSAMPIRGDQSSYNSPREAKKFRMPKGVRSKRVSRNVKRTLPRVDQEKGPKESAVLEENHSTKTVAAQVEDCHKGKSMEVVQVTNKEFDEEPLSNWIEETDSLSLLGDSSLLPTIQCLTDGERRILPFVKSSTSLWNFFESMEVFQKMPQKPHFNPLEQFSESLREGLAIGYMVIFSNLVKSISKLELNDDTMVTLEVLENHGFDISAIRTCVTELFSAKDKEEKLLDEVNHLKNQILEHSHESSRIEEELRELEEEIKKLQVKRELVESAKEEEDKEMASLQTRLKEAEENVKNVKGEVEGKVSAVLKVVGA